MVLWGMDSSKYEICGEQLLADIQAQISAVAGQRVDGPVITALCEALAKNFNRVLAPLIKLMVNPVVTIPYKCDDTASRLSSLSYQPLDLSYQPSDLSKISEHEKSRSAWNAALTGIGPRDRAPLSVYAEMGVTGWKCSNLGCPDRRPITSPTPPVCYTCGCQMTEH